MNRKKVILRSGVIFILLIVAITIGGVFNIKNAGLPDYRQDVKLEGLSAPVKVVRDQWGVPHITAKTEKDLYQVMGYVMAQDRFWQMDLLRRVTMGKLSEIFGKSMLETDILFRSLRISQNSKQLIHSSDPEIIESVSQFTKGVNQYLDDYGDNLPFEFTVLGYQPDRWETFHSLNLIGYMAWDLSSAWKSELLIQRIREKVGDEMMPSLLPDFTGNTTVFPDYQMNKALISNLQEILGTQERVRNDLGVIPLKASNNWAVSGKKSATGKPLLANDMHLSLFIPGIWYQVHQTVPGKLNVTGVALPGQPAIISGHNNDIAWGMTNVGTDDLDFYLETTDPDNPDRYLFKGEWREFEVVREVINIKGKEPVIKDIRFTHRGPVVSELQKEKQQVISMRWLGNEDGNEMRTVYLLNRARNWDEFKDALSSFVSVSQNVVYADVEGNIGMLNSGAVPIRPNGVGTEIAPGWTGEYEWKGLVPFDQKPTRFNPPSGFVASANNKTVDQSFPYTISTWGFASDYRIDRINQLLASKQEITIADYKAWQLDDDSSFVEDFVPVIQVLDKNRSHLTESEQAAFDLLKNWNGRAEIDSRGVTIANMFFLTLVETVARDEMGDAYFEKYFSRRSMTQQLFQKVTSQRDHLWLDDINTADKKETYEDIMIIAFRSTVLKLKELISNNPEDWAWGKLHRMTLSHPVGKVWIIDKLFNLNRGAYPLPGSFHTLPQFAYNHKKPFQVGHGPSQRHVYDLGDWDLSETVIPTGNSGIPGSRHYCDQTKLYVTGQFHKDPFSEAAVDAAAVYRAVFTP